MASQLFANKKKLQFIISEKLADCVKYLLNDKGDDIDQIDSKVTLVVDYQQLEEFEENCKQDFPHGQAELLAISFN